MPKTHQPRGGLDIEIVWNPEVVAAWERGETPAAVVELVEFLARAAADRDHKEYLEVGKHRYFSDDPNVDWAAHDAWWAAYDAKKEAERQQAVDEEKAQKREARRLKKAEALGKSPARPSVAEASPEMEPLSIKRRLEIADQMAALHPGKPVSAMLRELFPDLLESEALARKEAYK